MKNLVWTVLLVCACVGLGTGPGRMAAAQNPGVAEHVKQLELDWVKAEQAGDVTRLGEILARDWMGIGPAGSRRNRQQYLDVVKGGRYKLESFETGPIDVKVLGNVAVAQGSDIEKSTTDGKDSNGKYVWTDVYAERGGKWQAVRSHVSKVK